MPVSCLAIARSGSRCRSPVLAGKQYCFLHDPESAERRRAAARKGGREPRKRHRPAEPDRLSRHGEPGRGPGGTRPGAVPRRGEPALGRGAGAAADEPTAARGGTVMVTPRTGDAGAERRAHLAADETIIAQLHADLARRTRFAAVPRARSCSWTRRRACPTTSSRRCGRCSLSPVAGSSPCRHPSARAGGTRRGVTAATTGPGSRFRRRPAPASPVTVSNRSAALAAVATHRPDAVAVALPALLVNDAVRAA